MKFSLLDLKDILSGEIKKKKFILYKVNENSFILLSEIIKKEKGIVSSLMSNNIDYLITEANYDSNIENAIKRKITILQINSFV